MTNENAGVRLGDLLTGAGLLKPADLREAMLIAKQQGLPVGRVLIMSAYLTEHQLQAAVRAQSMLKDGLIDQETVVKALTLVGAEDLSLDDALKSLQWYQAEDAVTNKLGELLLEAEIISKEQLQSGLAQCQTIGLPLGRVLVVTSNISEQMLLSALNAQVLVRDQKITREQAIQALRAAKERQIPIEQLLAENGSVQLPVVETVRLGELLMQSGLLNEADLMSSVELGLVSEKRLGEVLVEQALVPQQMVNAALEIQKLVASGTIRKVEAAIALTIIHKKNCSVEEAIRTVQPTPAAQPQAAQAAVPIQAAPPPSIEATESSSPPEGTSAALEAAPSPSPATTEVPANSALAQPAVAAPQTAGRRTNSTNIDPQLSANSEVAINAAVLQVVEALPLYQYLQLAGLISTKDIELAVRVGSKDSDIMGRMLVAAEILQPDMVSVAQKSRELIVRGILSTEQAIAAVKTCNTSKISLEEAFRQFNWDMQALNEISHIGVTANQAAPASQSIPATQPTSAAQSFAVPTPTIDSGTSEHVPTAQPVAATAAQSAPPAAVPVEVVQEAQLENIGAEQAAASQFNAEPATAAPPIPSPAESTAELAPVPSLSSSATYGDLVAQSPPIRTEAGAGATTEASPAPQPLRATNETDQPDWLKQLEQVDGQQVQTTESREPAQPEQNVAPQASSAADTQISAEPQTSPAPTQAQSQTWTGDQPTVPPATPPQQVALDNSQMQQVAASGDNFQQPQIMQQQAAQPQMPQGQPMAQQSIMPPQQTAPQPGQLQQQMMQPPAPAMPPQQQMQMAPPPPPSPWEEQIPPAMQPTDWQPEPAASWEPKAQAWADAAQPQQPQPKPEEQQAAWQPEPPTSWEPTPTTSGENQDWDWQGQKQQETVPPSEVPPAVQWEAPSPAPEPQPQPQPQWRPAPQPSGEWTKAPNQGAQGQPAWGAADQGPPQGAPQGWGAAPQQQQPQQAAPQAFQNQAPQQQQEQPSQWAPAPSPPDQQAWGSAQTMGAPTGQQPQSNQPSNGQAPHDGGNGQSMAGAAWGAVENNSTVDGEPVQPINKALSSFWGTPLAEAVPPNPNTQSGSTPTWGEPQTTSLDGLASAANAVPPQQLQPNQFWGAPQTAPSGFAQGAQNADGSEETPQDNDKPKKRLMDFMPKLGS